MRVQVLPASPCALQRSQPAIELEDRIAAAEAAAEELDGTRDALRAEFHALAEDWDNELANLADELGDIAQEYRREKVLTQALIGCERGDKPLH